MLNKVWSRLDKSESIITGDRGSSFHNVKRLNDDPCTCLKSSNSGLTGREHLDNFKLFCFF